VTHLWKKAGTAFFLTDPGVMQQQQRQQQRRQQQLGRRRRNLIGVVTSAWTSLWIADVSNIKKKILGLLFSL
jgi:hypothetical protein